MVAILALAMLVAATPRTGSDSWTKNGVAHVRFYDLANIHGPFKLYVSSLGCPEAGCPTCPSGSGVTAQCVVPPDQIYQKWQPAEHYLEISFPCSAAGNLQYFYYTAVTCTADCDYYFCDGQCPAGSPVNGASK